MPSRSGTKKSPLHLTFVASEFAPLSQTGGLGEAVAGLAHALADREHALECILPAHPQALANPRLPALEETGHFEVSLPEGPMTGRWLSGRFGALDLHLFDLPALFDRESLYGGPDEGIRYAAFARAAATRCVDLGADVLVAHDWQAALSIPILRTLHDFGPARGIGTVQVVHNNAHQGCFGIDILGVSGLPGELFTPDGLEFFGELSLLKGGLAWADRIVAVSPSYAEELQTTEFGEGLEGLYRSRAHRLTGIANGIDVESYDPGKDAALPVQFDRRSPRDRDVCRDAVLEELELEEPEPGRLLTCIGRLAVQKGWDVVCDAAPALIEDGATLALLGDGDPEIAETLVQLEESYPGRVVFRAGWDDGLARRLYAGADAVLVPSRFEPCGLVQRIAQRYGALPIAHAVGGLQDTIRDGVNGILFEPLTVEALVEAVDRGAALRNEQGRALRRKLLREDVSWKKPAARWEKQLNAVAAEAAARL